MREHDFEPIRGLPGNLPEGEVILWQGSPKFWLMAQQAFHIRAVSGYFAVLIAWRAASGISAGQSPDHVLAAAAFGLPVALAGLGLITFLAWLNTVTTVYTITNKRVVMRFGAAATKAINLPFTVIDSASVKSLQSGGGDLALALKAPNKIAFLQLWPHARPWRMANPQPTLRGLADPTATGAILASAMLAEVPIEIVRHAEPVRERNSGAPSRHPEIATA